MKILLDESAPRIIQTQLRELDIRTVQEMGWGGLKNGELLALAEVQFDLFITGDKRIQYQQNLAGRRLALIVLPTNRVPAVITILPLIKATIEQIQPGAYVELSLPASK